MARQKLKSLVTSFSPGGEYFAVFSPNGVVKIWNTSTGSLLAEWRQSDANSEDRVSCIACSFVGKKHKKERGTCLLALGSDDGHILAVDVFTGERKWKSTESHAGGIAGLSFTNRGLILHVVANDGMASEIRSETGEVVQDFKISKKHISASASCCDEKTFATASGRIKIFSWENGEELLKFSANGGLVQHISISDEAKAIVTSGSGEKHLQVWNCNLSAGSVSKGPLLSMRHPPLAFECKNDASGEGGVVVLSVSESGVAYLWNSKTFSEEEIAPTKVTVKTSKGEVDLQNCGSTRRSQFPIMAARLHALETDGRVTVLIAYGPSDSPQFSFLDMTNPAEDIVITAGDETKKTSTETVQENGIPSGIGLHEEDLALPMQNRKGNNKRAASELKLADSQNSVENDIGCGEPTDGSQIDGDLSEPTMGEKLANLNLLENEEVKNLEIKESTQLAKPPSADSVHILLKQALHADDRVLILNCLYTRDEKVIANSVSLLNPSDVLKLLNSLISLIQSRGAVLVCALPWLRSLLLQHASGIMSQESSLKALNSLYQLIESRVSTFHPAVQLSSCIDLLYSGTVDDDYDENSALSPIIYEDRDESDEEESDDAMETGQEGGGGTDPEPLNKEESDDAMETDQEGGGGTDPEPLNDVSDNDDSDGMGFD